jgi:hypothetical protein
VEASAEVDQRHGADQQRRRSRQAAAATSAAIDAFREYDGALPATACVTVSAIESAFSLSPLDAGTWWPPLYPSGG